MNPIKPLLFLLTLASMTACSSATPESGVSESAEALIVPVTVTMYVKPGTVIHSPPNVAHLIPDPAHPGPVSGVDVAKNPPDSGTFVASSHHAFVNVTAAEYAAIVSTVDTPGRQTLVTLTYDSAAPGDNKTVLYPPAYSGPTFTLL